MQGFPKLVWWMLWFTLLKCSLNSETMLNVCGLKVLLRVRTTWKTEKELSLIYCEFKQTVKEHDVFYH